MLTERDPVCGMTVNRVTARRHEYGNQDYFFCSERCWEQFIANPAAVLAKPTPVTAESWFAKVWARFSGAFGKGEIT